MKKFICYLLIFCTCFSCLTVSATGEDAETPAEEIVPDASVTEGCHTIEAQRGILGERQLITNCTAAFLYEYTSDTLMYSWNGDMRIVPASFVKILTALIAIEKGNLQDQVTVHTASFSSLPHDAAMIRLPLPLQDGARLRDCTASPYLFVPCRSCLSAKR